MYDTYMDQKNIPNNEYNEFTFELRKFVSDFSKKNKLEENDFFDDERLSFDEFPKKTSLQLVFLILLYRKEVTESRLRSFSGQYAGITKSLRDRGFLFKGDTNSKFRFKNSKGEFCRKIEGYKKTLKDTKDYYYKISKESGKSKMIDGDKKTWGLADCIEKNLDELSPTEQSLE